MAPEVFDTNVGMEDPPGSEDAWPVSLADDE
jgi:hypothetical protein